MRVRTIGLIVTLFLGLLAPPLLAEGQEAGKVYRIGFLTTGSVEAFKPRLAALRQGLHELGYLEGKTSSWKSDMRQGEGNGFPNWRWTWSA